ncbi:hypothetical protein CLF_110387 [Clonorchis sinensis]|uniref:Ribosome biogenesis protein NOP53 n=1 Tax=Clonorchis sinensis TaxID=79923 RepID=G7YTH2_CLOSI|nr:hypothetical protein CLF_110387 [Clonorchis sinensis]
MFDELTVVVSSFGVRLAPTMLKTMLLDMQSLSTSITVQGEIVVRFTYTGHYELRLCWLYGYNELHGHPERLHVFSFLSCKSSAPAMKNLGKNKKKQWRHCCTGLEDKLDAAKKREAIIPKLLKELRRESQACSERKARLAAKKATRKRDQLVDWDIPFQMPNELVSCLRKVVPESDLLRELEKRKNKCPRARRTLGLTKSTKAYERRRVTT